MTPFIKNHITHQNIIMSKQGCDLAATPVEQNVGAGGGSIMPTTYPQTDPSAMIQETGQEPSMIPRVTYQWRQQTEFQWTPNTPAGTLMYYAPVHPAINEWTNHLSKMFNTWRGAMDFGVETVATYFHAGKLLVVRLPPNIHPKAVKNPLAATGFESVTLDIKMPRRVELEIKDQLPIAYHWTRQITPDGNAWDGRNMHADDIIDSLAIGGWFAVYVLSPLTTAQGTNNQITVLVWTKPGQNFLFDQIVPLSLYTTPPPLSVVDLTPWYTFKKGQHRLKHVEMSYVDQIIITTNKVAKVSRFLDYRADGTRIYKSQDLAEDGLFMSDVFMAKCTGQVVSNYAPITIQSTLDGVMFPPMKSGAASASAEFVKAAWAPVVDKQLNVDYNANVYLTTASSFEWLKQANGYRANQKDLQENITTGVSITVRSTYMSTKTDDIAFNQAQWADDPQTEFGTEKEAWFTPSVSGEVMVAFGKNYSFIAGQDSFNITTEYQTRMMREAYKQRVFEDLENGGQCLLLQLIDLDSEQPIGYFKLYPEGVITAPARSGQVIYPVGVRGFVFKALSMVPRNTQISNPNELRMNETQSVLRSTLNLI
nr:MAG: capsid protein [Wufeng shrew picorna-like virus 45]